jgi:hypothetical protein
MPGPGPIFGAPLDWRAPGLLRPLDLAAVHCSVLVDIARDIDANVQGAMVLEPLEVEVRQQLTSEVQPPTKTLSAT